MKGARVASPALLGMEDITGTAQTASGKQLQSSHLAVNHLHPPPPTNPKPHFSLPPPQPQPLLLRSTGLTACHTLSLFPPLGSAAHTAYDLKYLCGRHLGARGGGGNMLR